MKSNRVLLASVGICVVAAAAEAQVATPFGELQLVPPGQAGQRGGRAGVADHIPAAAGNVPAAWWTDPALMARLGLTDLQKSRIEATFQAHRANLAMAKAALESQEAQLSRLLGADSIDRPAVQLQISRVIQARAQMESVNAAMSLEMREQLTLVQWTQLQSPNVARGGGRGGGPVTNPAPDSFAAKYAADKPITLEGTVTEFKFQDPHTLIIFDAPDKDGKIRSWIGEMGPSTLLARNGWNASTLKPGDRVYAQGSRAHNPASTEINLRTIRRIP